MGNYNTANAKQEHTENQCPFFILGCVRSGTTILRDLLRLHPRLECPEETHFFRWADPFASYRYDLHYKGEVVFDQHRSLDGISDQAFFDAFDTLRSKKELADWYGTTFLRVRNNPGGRWFDKTPQNVYSIFLINEYYPEAKFLHIHRNPLNVVASLKEGKVMPAQPLRAAISVWVESIMLLCQFRRLDGEKLFELSYEQMTADPERWIRLCVRFVGEDENQIDYGQISTYPAQERYKQILTKDEIRQVLDRTEPYRSLYGYGL